MTLDQITGAAGEILRSQRSERSLASSKKTPVRSPSSTSDQSKVQDKVEISREARNLQNAASVKDTVAIDKERMELIVRRIKEGYYFKREVVEDVADTLLQSMWE